MPLTAETKLRRVIFRPYRKGMGPTFVLMTYDLGAKTYNLGRSYIGYRLVMVETEGPNRNGIGFKRSTVLFEGEDFGCSPLHAIDSDESIEGIMGFLTLRPGDTDREYFDNYTSAQAEYCAQHAEALSCEVMRRFGRDG